MYGSLFSTSMKRFLKTKTISSNSLLLEIIKLCFISKPKSSVSDEDCVHTVKKEKILFRLCLIWMGEYFPIRLMIFQSSKVQYLEKLMIY